MKASLLIVTLFLSIFALGAESAWKVGEYSVPVPAALAAYATFPVMYQSTKNAAGKTVLTYKLPEDLVTRNAAEIVLEHQATQGGFLLFSGPGGEASCRRVGESLTCLVLYPNLIVDDRAVEALLQEKYAGAADLLLRKQVASIFSADPKGIVNYDGTWNPLMNQIASRIESDY